MRKFIVGAVAVAAVVAAACGGGSDGGSAAVRGRIGGKAIATGGGRVRVEKLLGDVDDPNAIKASVEACGQDNNNNSGQFFLEVTLRRRTRTIEPTGSDVISHTPDCYARWADYVMPSGGRPTGVVYSPDAENPSTSTVRFVMPQPRAPTKDEIESAATSTRRRKPASDEIDVCRARIPALRVGGERRGPASVGSRRVPASFRDHPVTTSAGWASSASPLPPLTCGYSARSEGLEPPTF
jgi:hypothetical protein